MISISYIEQTQDNLFHGKHNDTYNFVPISYNEQIQGNLFSWKTLWLLYHVMKQCQVINFHGQTSDAYVTCHVMFERCKEVYVHG
jgi:hypothetical protein